MRKMPTNKSPVPVSRQRANAISPVTMTLLRRACERPAETVRPSSFRLAVTSTRDARSEGARLHKIAQTTEMLIEKSRTFVSRCNSSAAIAIFALRLSRTRAIPQWDNRTPIPPPSMAMMSDSVSNCRIIRSRPAPIELRIASSLRREAARASNNPDTFAHAISRTKPTVVMMTASPVRMPKL